MLLCRGFGPHHIFDSEDLDRTPESMERGAKQPHADFEAQLLHTFDESPELLNDGCTTVDDESKNSCQSQ